MCVERAARAASPTSAAPGAAESAPTREGGASQGTAQGPMPRRALNAYSEPYPTWQIPPKFSQLRE
jgi:hypothetical protein